MNLKVRPVDVDPAKPFSCDRLGRDQEIRNLSELVRNLNTPTVLAVNSGWGTGKTTFIKMWAAHLKLEGVPSLYFNAWSTDFASDPLVAFLGEMNDGLKGLLGSSAKARRAWSKAKSVGKQIAKRSVPALVKLGTMGVIDTDKIIEDETAKVLETLTSDALKAYEDHKSAIATFKESLQKVIESSPGQRPVVIFVDELDRCRPTYALSLLERIKHLFEVNGLIFVLALDKRQLGYSIEAIYGTGFDAQAYLQRFIDIDYALKKPDVAAYVATLYDALGLGQFFKARSQYSELANESDQLANVFIFLSQIFNFSLRELEQLLVRVMLAFCATKTNQYIYPILLAFLVVVREKNRSLYDEYIQENSSDEPMINYLHSLLPEGERFSSRECALMEGFIIAAKAGWDHKSPMLLKRQKELESSDITDTKKRTPGQ